MAKFSRRIRAHIAEFAHRTEGAVAVEFVLIAPILFALLFGIVTLGFFIGVSHSVNQLATDAARASVAGLDETERRQIAVAYLAEAERRYPLLTNEALSTTLDYDPSADHSLSISVSYNADGTLLDVANGFLGLGITAVNGRAYVAY